MPNVVQDFVEISIDNIYKFHPSSLQAVFLVFSLNLIANLQLSFS